jgi:hypothetical protein
VRETRTAHRAREPLNANELQIARRPGTYIDVNKPGGLGEFGTCSNPSATAANDFYVQAKDSCDANAYPRLKMYFAYADTGGPKAGPGCLSNYNQYGEPDAAKQASFNEFAKAVLARQ